MAQPLVSRIGASPLWRAGLASAFILGLAGFAAGVIPQACRSGVVICSANAPQPIPAEVVAPAEAAPVATPSVEPVAEVAETPTAVAAIDTMVKQQPASLTRNDVIAQTFAALDTEFTAPETEIQQKLTFELTVMYERGYRSKTDSVDITVNQVRFFGSAAGSAQDYVRFLEWFDQVTPENAGK